MRLTPSRLRADAIRRAFPAPAPLKRAIARMGFVQADPIRAPARAQDLILRQRATNYHAGDLERRYPALDIEEDFLYAYGFLTRENWQLLHPRAMGDLSSFDARVLDAVTRNGQMHPRELEAELGRERIVNAWGGYSKATTRALQGLHYRGLLRIARRELGTRIYEVSPPASEALSSANGSSANGGEERICRLAVLVCRILAPLPMRSLSEALRLLRYSVRGLDLRRSLITDLLKSGELESAEVDGLKYVWPSGRIIGAEPPERVRILAPFDPLVWDRRRFEHLWGWAYRLEAYTPAAKRVRGYYAMPILWRDRMAGWANVKMRSGVPEFEFGFQARRPRERGFASALDDEAERMRQFLQPARTSTSSPVATVED